MSQSRVGSIGILIVAMASVQTGASIAKKMFPIIGTLETTLLRLFISTFILWVVWRPWKKVLRREEWRAVLQYGFALGWMNLFFYMALDSIPLGLAVALEFTGPLSVAILSSKRAIDIIWAALAVIGILLILPFKHSLENVDLKGVMFALGAGLFWALYIVYGKKVSAKGDGGKMTAYGMMVAFCSVLPISFIQGIKPIQDLQMIPAAILMAFLSSALPYSLEMLALANLPAKTFSILMSLEPALAAISGLVFLNESLVYSQWAAIICIMIASAGSALTNEKV